jgi:hypothetical protein
METETRHCSRDRNRTQPSGRLGNNLASYSGDFWYTSRPGNGLFGLCFLLSSIPCLQKSAFSPFLKHMTPLHTFIPYFFEVLLILGSHRWLGLPNCLLPSSFQIRILYTFLIFSMLAGCHIPVTPPDLIALLYLSRAQIVKLLYRRCSFLLLAFSSSSQHRILTISPYPP